MEQEGLTKFKKELLTVRLDNETSAGGTADARWPEPPHHSHDVIWALPDLVQSRGKAHCAAGNVNSIF